MILYHISYLHLSLGLILKIIDQHDVKHIITLLVKTTSVLKVLTCIITSIATRPIGLHAILVIMFLLTLKTVVIKSPKQRLETSCFCSVSYYYYYSPPPLSFFLWHMNLSTADLRNYWTEFHETWWSYRYMFLVGPKVFSFVVKGVKVIF